MLQARPRPARRRVLVPAAAAVVLLLLAAAAFQLGFGDLGRAPTTAEQRIAADPQPPLFPGRDTSAVEQQIAGQGARARRLMQRWWAEHGRQRDDAAFAAYLQNTLPDAPSAPVRAAQAAALAPVVSRRSAPETVAAVSWLKRFGTHDVWRVFLHEQNAVRPAGEAQARTDDLRRLMPYAAKVATRIAQGARQPAPYVLLPALRPDKGTVRGQTCPCSYPSWQSAVAAAAATYLAADQPDRRGLYLAMQGRIAYARMSQGAQLPSDVAAGALLGDMVAEYFLAARG